MMARPCTCDREDCPQCRRYHTDPAYRRLCDGLSAIVNRRQIPCRYLGSEVRRQTCPTCRGTVELKVFACALHGECTLGKALPGVACCAQCSDYAPTEVDPKP